MSTIKTTEITVTTEVAGDKGIPLGSMSRRDSNAAPNPRSPSGAYSVHISADSYNMAQSNDDVELPIQGTTLQPPPTRHAAPRRPAAVARRRNHELNNAAWSYTKCSILFFTAMLITWIPSSANRVYSLVHQNEVSIPLEFMSAFVLPLQGFWNAVIYAVTSWSACLEFFDELKLKKRPAVSNLVGSRRGNDVNQSTKQYRSQFRSPVGSSRTFVTDSTTELAKPRSNSADDSHHC